ncbi:MAG: DUF177 domain-containing protein [Pseudomonadota bacterium]
MQDTQIAPLPFERSQSVAALMRGGETPVHVVLEADEAQALAQHLDVRAVQDVALEGKLVPEGEGWRLDARLRASVEQACVITLEPVVSALDLPVLRRFMPGAGSVHDGVDGEIDMGAEEEDGPDPLGDEIDLATVLVEALALAIEPYPRKEGAEIGRHLAGPPGVEPLTDEAARPFAKLAALRDQAREPKE